MGTQSSGPGFGGKCRGRLCAHVNKCQVVECVSKVWNTGIMNAVILKILEKLKSFCLGNQQSEVSGDR